MGHYEDLVGKRVLVTGASRGIGAGVARAFAAAGARLFLHYRSDRRLAEKVAARGGSLETERDGETQYVTLLLPHGKEARP